MRFVQIVLIGIAASVIYGVLHDQITARICVEYFTIGHPPIFGTTSPTLLGLGWGVIATCWLGALLGAVLAAAALLGRRPRRTPRSLVRPVALLMAVTAAFAILAGAGGFVAASRGWIILLEPLASRVPAESRIPFLAVLWAHSASYLVASVGGLVLVVQVWRSRRRLEGGQGPARGGP